jgi:hypothetical protein
VIGTVLRRLALLAVATVSAASVARVAAASQQPHEHVVTTDASTGAQSFVISPQSGFSSDTTMLGQDRLSLGHLAFNPALGSIIGSVAMLAWTGDTFKAVYEVEGFGNELVFSDQVTVKAIAILDGMPIGTPETASVDISSSCGGPDQIAVLRDCTVKGLLNAFTDSQSIPLPAGASFSSVTFDYAVLNSNENCVANTYTSGSLTGTGACLQGGVSIVDTSNLFDPGWSAKLGITYAYNAPEPPGMWLLVFGLAGLVWLRYRSAGRAQRS